jgi:hypothetical protein
MQETRRHTTNVAPRELNYDHYTKERYDRDIVRVIPFHKEIHKIIYAFLRKSFGKKNKTSASLTSALEQA